MKTSPFFWLHIKKSAGTSVRNLLGDHYQEVERVDWPANFIQSDPAEYNDILNNYRVVLGKYQFKRCQFAQEFLYTETWGSLLKFAFVRDPVSRARSMFFYLHRQGVRQRMARSVLAGKPLLTRAMSVDHFLDCVEQVHSGDGSAINGDRHFSTHTAPMWDDVTDQNGKIMLDRIYRVEALEPALREVMEACGLEPNLRAQHDRLNATRLSDGFEFNRDQMRRIERIYAKDFDLYESALLAD